MTDRFSRALEQLIRRSQETVRGIGLRHGLGEPEIDELFQDVRIRLWKSQEGVAERVPQLSSAYVYRTAVTAALDMIRRRRRESHLVGLDETAPDPRTPGPGRMLEEEALMRRLEGALARLHPRRAPVVRMYLAGYSREEIGELLGWTEAKTRNLLYRGLADLRAGLEEGV